MTLARFIFAASCSLLLASCVTWTPRSQRVSPAATVIPNMPMQKWGIESCGPASLSTVLQHYGDPLTMAQWDAKLPKTRGGVMSIDLVLAARQRGFEARLVTGTPESVAAELREGRPVILMLQVVDSPGHEYDFFHFVVADGIDPQRNLIRTQFGDGKARWVTFDRLARPWKGGGHAALFIKPDPDPANLLRTAVALEDEGKYADAAERYRVVLLRHPDNVVAWTNLGNAESQLGSYQAAEEAFRKALALDDSSRDTLNNLAWLLFTQKRLPEAETLARRAASIPGPDSYLMLDTLARILAAKGSCEEAAATFREAIESVPATRAQARSDLEKGLAETRQSCHS
ncbi:MAG TPA: tetratricopeptide repeat protein [Thermoanaerobaculia bacterium]|nr:tetratricopeptide repeat protein [Thermoanaerobaculia bacterium]